MWGFGRGLSWYRLAPGPRAPGERQRLRYVNPRPDGPPKGPPRAPPRVPPRVPQGFKASRILVQRSPQSVPTSPGPELGARARGPGQGLGSGPGRAQHLGPEFGAPGPRGPGARAECVVALCCEPRAPGPGARGRGPRLDARRGDGPRARDRGTKYAATVLQSRSHDLFNRH